MYFFLNLIQKNDFLFLFQKNTQKTLDHLSTLIYNTIESIIISQFYLTVLFVCNHRHLQC